MARHAHQPGRGRHRLGTPELVHCRKLTALREQPERRRLDLRGVFRDGSRHTVGTVRRRGARPRLAFVLIASM